MPLANTQVLELASVPTVLPENIHYQARLPAKLVPPDTTPPKVPRVVLPALPASTLPLAQALAPTALQANTPPVGPHSAPIAPEVNTQPLTLPPARTAWPENTRHQDQPHVHNALQARTPRWDCRSV